MYNAEKSKSTGNILEGYLERDLKKKGFDIQAIKLVYRGYDWFMVLSVTDEAGGHFVVFNSGETAASVIRSTYARIMSDSATYKPDKWKTDGVMPKKPRD